jgi:hypothetical protein
MQGLLRPSVTVDARALFELIPSSKLASIAAELPGKPLRIKL